MSARGSSAWQDLSPSLRLTLSSAWRSGVSPTATALYARWWQLETWLRSLVYVERSARHGRGWADGLPAAAEQRERRDKAHSYMASPDAQDRLAYLDATPLLTDVLINDWDLYAETLIDRDVWTGRVVELLKIRHRIGHCRRPHSDDLGRLQQTLRDLEPGAFRAVAAFNRQSAPADDLADPVVDAWCRGKHPDAARLLAHARTNYEIQFDLRASRRPWAGPRSPGQPISGSPGYLWHATFTHTGGRPVDLRRMWDDSYMTQPRDLLVFLTANDPFSLEVSFAAVDDPAAISDAIGCLFDAVLMNPDYRWRRSLDEYDRWLRTHQDLDPRVQLGTEWAIVDDTTPPISIFGVPENS